MRIIAHYVREAYEILNVEYFRHLSADASTIPSENSAGRHLLRTDNYLSLSFRHASAMDNIAFVQILFFTT